VRRPRRRYERSIGCQDCGRGPATTVRFWASGLKYRVCAHCIRAYRGVILAPCPKGCSGCARDEVRQ
jgi:hypothetical protein